MLLCSGSALLTSLGWAWEHRLLLNRAATALTSLQEGQQLELMTPGIEQDMDLLGRLVAAHQQRNVPASGTWFERVLDEGELLLSWDQLLEKAS